MRAATAITGAARQSTWTGFDGVRASWGRHRTAFVLVCTGLAMNAAAEADAIHRFRGDAYDLKTGAFVYSENHSAFHKGNEHIYSRVSYRDKTGHEFASKLITFAPVKTQPTFELNDTRDGYLEGIRRETGKTVYYARRAKNQQTKSKVVNAPQPAVFDAGFDYFVQQHLEQICAGTNKSFFFAVPVELDYFKFRLARKSVSEVCHVYLELDNVLLRQVVKPIKLWYDMARRRLVKYEGISNINGSDGKSMYVRVVFSYQDK